MKYIKHKELGFILFENSINHSTFAEWFGGKDKVESAGFVADCGLGVSCYGESTTLRCEAHPDDSEKLRRRLEL